MKLSFLMLEGDDSEFDSDSEFSDSEFDLEQDFDEGQGQDSQLCDGAGYEHSEDAYQVGEPTSSDFTEKSLHEVVPDDSFFCSAEIANFSHGVTARGGKKFAWRT
jgi:hypothetical protein